ncbi:MAG TPA: hypothetical protein VLR88_01975 [Propionibacteriaceae bacterium]|nr:hypothetical protein [Propionibacteriaceae bacterium]
MKSHQVKDRMDREWNGFADAALARELVDASACEQLEGCDTLDDVVVCCGDDRVCRALLALAQSPGPLATLAGRVMVQAMLPALMEIASRHPGVEPEEYVSTAWLRVMTVEGAAVRRSVLTRLVLDTLKQLSRDKERRGRVELLPTFDDDLRLAWGCPGRQADAECLLDRARALHLVTDGTADLLRAIHLDGAPVAGAANERGMSHAAARKRSSVAMRRLRAHQGVLLGTA